MKTTATTAPYTNQYNEALNRDPRLLDTMSQMPCVRVQNAPDAIIADLAIATHLGVLNIASAYLEIGINAPMYRTLRTWAAEGSKITYFYGETLDLVLVAHQNGEAMQAFKGFSMLSR